MNTHKNKIRLIFIIKIMYLLSSSVLYAQEKYYSINNWIEINSSQSIAKPQYIKRPTTKATGLNINFNKNSITGNVAFSYSNQRNIISDGSYIQKSSENISFGIGKIDRHWSFSNKTSLILSKNARPAKTLYFKISNKKLNPNTLFSIIGPWSLEIFNGDLINSTDPKKPMLFGMRATINPLKNLEVEFLRTSQWGGAGYNNNLSAFKSIFIGDTNSGDNKNINQMAGFGYSYILPYPLLPIKLYGQYVGEDEAGLLPSCFMTLNGVEIFNDFIRFPTSLGFELVDTTIDYTQHGNCGPNTAYNNNVYPYTNYGTVIGAPIDSESTSIEIFGNTKLSEVINLKYSVKKININKHNSPDHRLTTINSFGTKSSVSLTWKWNKLSISTAIFNQDFKLDTANIHDSMGFSFLSTMHF
jgi:hypothetical protein